jgi:hypothetical protein
MNDAEGHGLAVWGVTLITDCTLHLPLRNNRPNFCIQYIHLNNPRNLQVKVKQSKKSLRSSGFYKETSSAKSDFRIEGIDPFIMVSPPVNRGPVKCLGITYIRVATARVPVQPCYPTGWLAFWVGGWMHAWLLWWVTNASHWFINLAID